MDTDITKKDTFLKNIKETPHHFNYNDTQIIKKENLQ